jgi:hypothetical protein
MHLTVHGVALPLIDILITAAIAAMLCLNAAALMAVSHG